MKSKKILSCLFSTLVGVSVVSCSLPAISNASGTPNENTSKSDQYKPKKRVDPIGVYSKRNPLSKFQDTKKSILELSKKANELIKKAKSLSEDSDFSEFNFNKFISVLNNLDKKLKEENCSLSSFNASKFKESLKSLFEEERIFDNYCKNIFNPYTDISKLWGKFSKLKEFDHEIFSFACRISEMHPSLDPSAECEPIQNKAIPIGIYNKTKPVIKAQGLQKRALELSKKAKKLSQKAELLSTYDYFSEFNFRKYISVLNKLSDKLKEEIQFHSSFNASEFKEAEEYLFKFKNDLASYYNNKFDLNISPEKSWDKFLELNAFACEFADSIKNFNSELKPFLED